MPKTAREWEHAFAAELVTRHPSFRHAEALEVGSRVRVADPGLTPQEAVEVFLLERPPLDAGEPGD